MVKPFLVLLAAAATAMAEPRLFFSKSFPGSVPAYVAITVAKDGACEYREAPDDDSPLKFQLASAEVSEMFALADKLDRFKRPLESPLKVAKMGMKTFRFEDGAARGEVQFNFTEDLDGRSLTDWFEKISETSQYYIGLERTVKYDKLGVNRAVLLLQAAIERKRVVSLPSFLPLLDRIVKNDAYLNMARSRAAGLAEGIRASQ
ncbi:MAG: hypothetical protein HYR60_06560 [Acidobacteria bacterium]|nr:hypothetical protein [Acidobacteriota bacterium]MBI3470894.1 hypothetical protein [Candidatus Solibacter usitatus]